MSYIGHFVHTFHNFLQETILCRVICLIFSIVAFQIRFLFKFWSFSIHLVYLVIFPLEKPKSSSSSDTMFEENFSYKAQSVDLKQRDGDHNLIRTTSNSSVEIDYFLAMDSFKCMKSLKSALKIYLSLLETLAPTVLLLKYKLAYYSDTTKDPSLPPWPYFRMLGKSPMSLEQRRNIINQLFLSAQGLCHINPFCATLKINPPFALHLTIREALYRTIERLETF